MKKLFTLCAAILFAAGTFAQSYGILVNGTTYYAGTQVDEFEGFQQYLAHVPVESGDQLQLCDFDNKAVWAVTLNTSSVSGFSLSNDHYEVTVDGCYDFYIKLKYGQDQLYIGPGSNCGEGVPYSGGDDPVTPPVTPGADAYWYWKGHVDGVDINSEIDGGLFDCGISDIEVAENAYIFVVYQVHGVPGVQYMAPSYVDGPTHATMTTTGGDKLHIPAGNWTLYLYDNGDGTVELSYEQLSGKTLVSCEGQGVEQTVVAEKAHKVIIDGKLRIVRGDKIFDATGREL
jgi:hypothetical protein